MRSGCTGATGSTMARQQAPNLHEAHTGFLPLMLDSSTPKYTQATTRSGCTGATGSTMARRRAPRSCTRRAQGLCFY